MPQSGLKLEQTVFPQTCETQLGSGCKGMLEEFFPGTKACDWMDSQPTDEYRLGEAVYPNWL